jgi:hypothetical protein
MIAFRVWRRAVPLWAAIALASGLAAHPASGQTETAPAASAPAPAASAAATVATPKPDCGEKPEHPGPLGSDRQKRQWRTEANAYLECYKKFAMEQRAIAQKYLETANALIDDYNAAVKEMQAAAEAAAQGN